MPDRDHLPITVENVGTLRRLLEGISDGCAITPVTVNFVLDLENGSYITITPAKGDGNGSTDNDPNPIAESSSTTATEVPQ